MKTEYVYELTEEEYKALLHTAARAREMDSVMLAGDDIGCVLRQMDLTQSLNALQRTFSDKELSRFGW